MKVIINEQTDYNLSEIEAHLRQVFTDLNIAEKLANKRLILLKPNMLGAHKPEQAVTTHPLVLEAVIRLLQELDKEVIVGDSPGGSVKASTVWQVCGYQEVCSRYNVRLIDFGKEGMFNIHSGALKFYFDKCLCDCDAIINLPKLKTHSMLLYTGAVKNFFGVIPGLYKSELHKLYPSPNDFSVVISTIYNLIKPKVILNIIDGIVGMDGHGPSAGNPYPFGVLISSENSVAADIIGSSLMGFKQGDIIYINQCLQQEDFALENIEVERSLCDMQYPNVDIKSVQFRNKMLNKLPSFLKKTFVSLFAYKPAFKADCKLCGVCVQSCPVKALAIVGDKVQLTNRLCIKCLCCHEVCPTSSIYLKRSMVAKMVFKG